MVDDAEVSIDTNLAGCNTANTVTIAKTDLNGLVNAGASSYDSNVFQANLPYQVTASYVAGPVAGRHTLVHSDLFHPPPQVRK